jgi:hypothetical protein
MAKVALATLMVAAAFALLVVFAGSIPPQAAPTGRAALGAKHAAQDAERRADAELTTEAIAAPTPSGR